MRRLSEQGLTMCQGRQRGSDTYGRTSHGPISYDGGLHRAVLNTVMSGIEKTFGQARGRGVLNKTVNEPGQTKNFSTIFSASIQLSIQPAAPHYRSKHDLPRAF